ncbi:hypothetical protein DVH05_011291 [Phytophthora capsici]|nr:hypothetical protein DVH05_011291 [Phytophthora capsici]
MNRPGRPSVPERNHFTELDELTPAKGGCKMCVCKHCGRAYSEGTRNDPPDLIQARPRNYPNPLKGCRHYREAHEQLVGATPPSASVGSKLLGESLPNVSSHEDDEPSRKRINLSRTPPPSSTAGHKRSRYSEGIGGEGDMQPQANRAARALELSNCH